MTDRFSIITAIGLGALMGVASPREVQPWNIAPEESAQHKKTRLERQKKNAAAKKSRRANRRK